VTKVTTVEFHPNTAKIKYKNVTSIKRSIRMKATLKKIAVLSLTLVFAFGINIGLSSALDSDILDSLFGSDTAVQQSEIYAHGNSMVPDSPRPGGPRPD
jgi:hypothetical protein